MGRKRRHRDRDSSERILKKLERQLRKRRRRSYSSSSDRSDLYADSDNELSYGSYYEPSPSAAALEMSEVDKNEPEIGDSHHVVLNEPSTSATDAPATKPPIMANENDKNESIAVESDHLDDEILTILGDAPKEESPVGQEVHADIATRLQDILLNGLKKENKEKIVEAYPIPANCPLFKAPALNAEVKAAVSDILQKKDASLAARQTQIGTALTALARVMDILATNKSETNQLLLKHVSNASRLLCDSHYIDTKMRRNFLISTLNNKLKETLKESKRDQKLFGEALAENLKATKAINKSSLDLKSQVYKPKANMKNSKDASSSNHLNSRHPQPNQNTNRRTTTASHRTAGSSSTAHRNETTRKSSSGPRAHRTSARYRNQRRS